MNRLLIAVLIALLAGAAPVGAGLLGTQRLIATSAQSLSEDAAYAQECEQDIEDAQRALAALEGFEGSKTVATVLEPLNDLFVIVDRARSKASLFRNVHPNGDIRDAATTCQQEIAKIASDLGLSRSIYDAVAALDVSKEDAATQRYVGILLRNFRRAGVDQASEVRERIRELREEIVKIGQQFGKNINEDVRYIELAPDELAGLPRDYIEQHPPGDNGKVRLSTNYPDYVPFMTYAMTDSRRLDFYKVYRRRGYPNNEAVLSMMVAKRYELARLLGYENWAHYVTEDKMIKTAKAARDFIDEIAALSAERAGREYATLLERQRAEFPGATAVGDWQKTYVQELVRREAYGVNAQEVRQYFPYNRVKQGLLDITGRMFGVTYEKVDVPVWDPSVEAYELRSGDEVIGRFYLDMHPRENKYKHAAAFTIQSGLADRQLPAAALVCNFPEGDDLMEHSQVASFFHEFGHLLHNMFAGRQRWVGLSGIRTEWDFVEAPSQMLAEWVWDPDVLRSFARNKDTQVIPAELVAKMRRAREFGRGLSVRHQMFYAAVSLNLYDRDPTGLNTTNLLRDLQAEYSPFAYVDDTYFQYSFGHLDGYSAIYYTYMWSLVIAKDLFSVFEREGLLNPAPALRYRKYVLEPGGSKDAAVLVRDFLGRDYSFESFGRWLNGTDASDRDAR